ncbi:MAG: hypothetical protein MUC72_01430 [Acidobacteria bacterium]|nr:hypothetical protein [Acidobacteriota bacterium]
MKRTLILAFLLSLLLLPCLRAYGDVTLLDTEKSKLQLYGFFKLDAAYQDGGVNGLTFPRYATGGDGNLYLSATHTRFGLKYAGAPLSNGMNLSAVLEWDFFDTASPNQMKPRFRQGYFSLAKKGHSLLFGQAWDLFSPLGPTTLMINGYLWQTGNVGFRHAQVRYTYSALRFDFAASISDPATAGGWAAIMPVLQGRLGLKLGANGRYQVGLSGIYGREKASAATVAFNNTVAAAGASLDWNLSICKRLALKGEFLSGANLTYVVSRAGLFTDIARQEFAAKKVQAFWSELLLSEGKWNGWLGYAFEDLSDDDQLAARELKKTGALLAGVQFAAGSGVSFGLEFAHFTSDYFLSAKAKTNQVMFSALLSL